MGLRESLLGLSPLGSAAAAEAGLVVFDRGPVLFDLFRPRPRGTLREFVKFFTLHIDFLMTAPILSLVRRPFFV